MTSKSTAIGILLEYPIIAEILEEQCHSAKFCSSQATVWCSGTNSDCTKMSYDRRYARQTIVSEIGV